MMDIIGSLLPAPAHFYVTGYWIAFFAALVETTIGIGLIIPGSTIILILGALSARGSFDAYDLIWFAATGAILGDNINYYWGRKYASRWQQHGFGLLKSSQIEKSKYFINRYGATSIFLGRLISGIKEVIPLAAGSVKISYGSFVIWNILGTIIWSCTWIFVGHFCSQLINATELWLSRAGLFIPFSIIVCFILYILNRLIIFKGRQTFSLIILACHFLKMSVMKNKHVSAWMKKHPQLITFLLARMNRTTFTGFPLSIFIVAFIYVCALFAGVVEDFINSESIVAADLRMANVFYLFRNDAITTVFTWITLFGKLQIILLFMITTIAMLWLWHKKHYIIPLLISVTGSLSFTYLGKLAFSRARPALSIYSESTFSFPSGHACIAIALYGFIGYLLICFTRNWHARVNIFFVTLIVIVLIGISRVYLGVHYISDIWSGYLLGTIWLIIAISLSEWFRHNQKSTDSVQISDKRRLSSFPIIFFALLFYSFFALNYHPVKTIAPQETKVNIAKIEEIFTTEQSKYTESVIGKKQEPLNFIFIAKDDRSLISILQQAGWSLTDNADIPSFIQAIKALIYRMPHPTGPISPSFWSAQIQDIAFRKIEDVNWLKNGRHIRIWQTKYTTLDGNNIYLGMTNSDNGFKWGVIPAINPDLDTERERLYSDLEQTGKIKHTLRLQLVKPLLGYNFAGDPFFSDGKLYVVSVQ